MLKTQHLTLAAYLLLSACAVRGPATWRVEGRILSPPATRHAITLKTSGACPSNEAIAVRRGRSRTVLTVNPDALARQTPGWLAAWSAQVEESGCVSAGQGLAMAQRVLEQAPLGLGLPYRLLHADHARSGYVDLGPESRLEVVTPIRRPGAGSDTVMGEVTGVTGSGYSLDVTGKPTGDLVGVETAWYAVRANGVVPIRTEARIQGVREPRTAPARNFFENVGPGFYRLVYKADQTSVIVVARSLAERERANSEDCGKCVVVPRFVAVNPYLAINVNGSDVIVPVGSTLRTAVRVAGKRPEEVMGTLAISKPFAGRQVAVEFDRTKLDVMDLVLLGNEVVRW
jgi:hypothetical protein